MHDHRLWVDVEIFYEHLPRGEPVVLERGNRWFSLTSSIAPIVDEQCVHPLIEEVIDVRTGLHQVEAVPAEKQNRRAGLGLSEIPGVDTGAVVGFEEDLLQRRLRMIEGADRHRLLGLEESILVYRDTYAAAEKGESEGDKNSGGDARCRLARGGVGARHRRKVRSPGAVVNAAGPPAATAAAAGEVQEKRHDQSLTAGGNRT